MDGTQNALDICNREIITEITWGPYLSPREQVTRMLRTEKLKLPLRRPFPGLRTQKVN